MPDQHPKMIEPRPGFTCRYFVGKETDDKDICVHWVRQAMSLDFPYTDLESLCNYTPHDSVGTCPWRGKGQKEIPLCSR